MPGGSFETGSIGPPRGETEQVAVLAGKTAFEGSEKGSDRLQ